MAKDGEGLIGKLSRARRLVALGVLAAVAPGMAGCYGRFPLTKSIYRMNGTIGGVFEQIVFWVFVIVPVYGVSMLADALVFNLIEFWTGASVPVGQWEDGAGNTVALAPGTDAREAVMTVSRDGRVVSRVRFVRVSETLCEVRDSGGNLAGTVVRTPEGDIRLTDERGSVVSTIDAARLAALKGS